ncbi:hypothetical protein AMECASPLE_008854, partial [Ameca splendens]
YEWVFSWLFAHCVALRWTGNHRQSVAPPLAPKPLEIGTSSPVTLQSDLDASVGLLAPGYRNWSSSDTTSETRRILLVNDITCWPPAEDANNQSPPMFLRRLSSFSSSFHPRGHPVLCRASKHQPFTPASHPWSSGHRFPPWPPRLPPPRPLVRPIFTGSTFNSFNTQPGRFNAGGLQSLHTFVGLMMERPDREPPNKRWKSGEERTSIQEMVSHRGGGARETRSQAKERESKQKHYLSDFRRDGSLPTNQNSRIRNKPTTGAEKVCRRDNSIDKAVERTKGERKGGRDTTPNQRSQPAGSRTQLPKSTSEPDPAPVHKPNPWFKGKAAEELSSLQRNRSRSGEPQMAGGSEAERWTRLQSQPSNATQDPNQRQGEHPETQPPSAGTSQPVKCLQRHWETCSTEPQPPGDSTVFDFSVMSYNILSQELLQDNAYLYRHCDPDVLPWQYRLPNLLAEIQQHDPDHGATPALLMV